MSEILPPAEPDLSKQPELFHPGHFYAAYSIDQPGARAEDIRRILEESGRLGYRVRYWWLSNAIDLEGSPDRLIVCVHHPSQASDAGIDLYNSLVEQRTRWDDLEAAAVEEYQTYGCPIRDLSEIRLADGMQLFFPSEERYCRVNGSLFSQSASI